MYHPQQPVHQPQFRATGRRSSSAPSSQQPQQSEACWTGHHSHTSAPLAHRPAPVSLPSSTRKLQQQQQQIRAHSPYSRGNSPHPPTPIHKPPTLHQPAALVSPSAQHNNTTQAPSPSNSAPTVFCPRTPQMVTSSNHAAVTPSGERVDTIAAIKAIQAANAITSKPPRPYTEYTMFYQLEREYIIQRLLKDNKKTDGGDSNKVKKDEVDAASTPPVALFANDPLMPAKFRSLPLRADWYISGKSKKPTKRKHRKSHGKIGFLELTRMIAARWAKVEDETRKYCKMMAAMELVKYKEDMESYNKYTDQLRAIGQIPEDMKERMIKKKISQQKKVASNRAKGKKDTPVVINKKKRNASGPPPLPPIMRADHVGSSMTMMTRGSSSVAMPSLAPIKLEQPLVHTAPLMHNGTSNLDNDMEQFISTLVQSPNRPTTSKTIITPDRSSPRIKKRRMLFRDKSTGSTTAAALANIDEMTVPLKGDGTSDDHYDGIKMTFSGIDENEIAREFSDHVHRPRQGHITGSPVGTCMKKMEPSFDYWDALVGV